MTRVLYVDDEDDIREIAELALSLDPQFEVRCASSGHMALAIAAEWLPDLILLDVMMPHLDGPQVLARLRQSLVTSAIPVVFCTARAQANDVGGFQALDAKGVIAKPFNPMTLAAQARSFL